jgi:hypothetical protein
MKNTSKLARTAVLVSSLTLLVGYVIYSQSRGRTAVQKTEKEFMLPSSKALTNPVFTTSKTRPSADADSAPTTLVFPVIPDSKNGSTNPFAPPAQKP